MGSQERKQILMKRRSRRHLNGRIKRKVRTLKRLVPNGRSKGLDELFKDTADYIICLQMRVNVMQMMVKLLSETNKN